MKLTGTGRTRRPRPIGTYALAFFLLLTLALALLGTLVFRDMAHLNAQVRLSDAKLAHQELGEAVALLKRQAQDTAQILAQWDEARAQLENPTYYAYWRGSRALSAGVLPRNVDAVDLYDVRQANLSATTTDEHYMPPRFFPQDMQPTVVQEKGHAHLYYFAPLYTDTSNTKVLGYVGLKFDVLEELRQLRKFRYLDISSLRIGASEGESFLLDDLVARLRFLTVANPEVRALEKLTRRSFYEIAAVVLVTCVIGYFALLSVIARPLRNLSGHIDAMRRGEKSPLDDSYGGVVAVTELEKVRSSLNDYQQQLDDMHVSLAHKNEELWVLAHHDPLTGVYNRRAFDDDWRALRRTQGDVPQEVAFLLFDCDHFKAINDTYGHQVGDLVIQGLAECLHRALRTGDRLYRLGGDEFATVLFATDVSRARQVAERCIEQISQHDFSAYGIKEPVRVSVGIAYSKTSADDTLELLHRQADVAMYHAKRPGQAKIAVHSPEMGENAVALVSNADTTAVYDAIADPDCLELHYQPVVALPAAQLDYYEALVRIRRGDKLVMPSSIFPVVEMRGLECDFDLAVFERIGRDLHEGKVAKGVGVSINVSGPGIVNSRIIDKLMQFAPLLPDYKLVLEITETALITQIAHASANLHRLRQAGFVIALDDFGSGYSSLRYLASMPVDSVKFDISMVRSLEDEGRQALFVEDLARMIKDAGYSLVAEGIESEALLRRVAELGFSHAQGFHIGRPAALAATSQPSQRFAT
jgi:diguanylate cyclase (GGDEF)-like protein